MPLSSLFQRFRQMAASGRAAVHEPVHISPSDVEAARVRARRRLIGMAVLVGAGVIGFPWLFETQPRQMSQDVELVQASSRIGGGEEGLSIARGASRAASGRVAVAGIVPPAESRSDERRETEADTSDEPREAMSSRPPVRAGEADERGDDRSSKPSQAAKVPEKLAQKSAERPAEKSLSKVADQTAVKTAAKTTDKTPEKPSERTAAKSPEKAPEKSVDKPSEKVAEKPGSSRYVVQFGAFADANAARTTRMKVERLGIKTYAQQVDTPAGKRIRVRIGPYVDKAEADKALGTLRKAGLTGAVLTL